MFDINGLGSIAKLGETIIDKLFPDKNQAEQLKIKLIELEQAGEFKQIDSALQQTKIDADDRASARAMASAKATAGQKDYLPSILAAIVTMGFFGIIILLCIVDIDQEVQTVLNIMIGYLGASLNQVFGFYFGSSSSSRAKDNVISKLSFK